MRHTGILILLPFLLAGCAAVGPNYGGAPASAPQASARGAFLRGGGDTTRAEPAARWWEALGDPVLGQVIDEALRDSPNVAIANARIAQARAGLAANRTALFPSVNVSAATPYINVPGGLLSPDGQSGGRDSINVYNVGFDASWELDLFGGTRRRIEAASARAEAAEAGLADAQVTLSAEIARAYVSLRTRQAALAVLDRQALLDDRLLTLAEQRLAQGTAPAQPVAQARAQRAQTEADRATTRADIVVLTDQIAVLAGREPGALDALLGAPAPIPLPPAEVAVGDPARLLRQRPDIRTAERQLAAASADIGVAVADQYPKISFLGLLGLGGQNVGDIFDPSKIIGLALPQLKLNLFDGGRARNQVERSRGSFAEAEAMYRRTVLAALQDAESALTRFGAQRVALGKALEVEQEGARTAALQRQRADAGTLGASDAILAERQALQASLASATARGELTSSFVAVEKALGLGWSAPEPGK